MGDDRRHEDLVFKYLLERWARTTPDRVFAWFHEEDSSWTWSEADRRANQAAHALAGAGASRGSHVAAMLPNGTRYLATIFGLGKLGAVHVGLNTAYRGAILEHALNLSESPLIVIDARFVDRLLGLDLRHLRSLVVFGQLDEPTRSAAAERFDLVDGTAFDHAPDHTPPVDQIHLWDPYAIIFTSGTTGPSKGVLSPYGQLAAQVGYYHVPSSTADDVYLVDLPMFHVGGQMALMGMLQVGGSIVMKEVFTATGYWELCIRYGITRATMLSTMANFLAAQPVSPLEKQHAVRSVLMAPVLDNVHAWQERFGIAEVWVMFNMTEVSSPLMRTGPVVDPATCGRPRPGAEVRVVDENDIEVPPGQVGELIVRTDLPWEMNLGYYGMPEATQAAWRNGWFHTGDAFRRDADGNHYYIDRIKDCIRRRGENVSSFEVESEINTYDGVQESAVVAVPSEHGEDEIKACIVARDGADIELPGLVAHLAERLPYFMVPRYYEVIPALPMTPTSKVKKADLRAAGRTSSTWDREAAGIKVSR